MHDLTIMLHIENAGDLYTFTYWASVRYERVVQCSDSIIHDTSSIVFNERGGGGGGGSVFNMRSQGRFVSLSLYAIVASGECAIDHEWACLAIARWAWSPL